MAGHGGSGGGFGGGGFSGGGGGTPEAEVEVQGLTVDTSALERDGDPLNV